MLTILVFMLWMVGLMALTKSEDLDAEVGGFLKSFTVKPGDAPPAGDGTK